MEQTAGKTGSNGAICDLVLLTWDHLEETQPCVESLLKYTDVPSRLLIVDNGSVSPAKEYVESVKPSGNIVEVRLLRNATNEGYPRGMNRGMRESTAPYVCLLNNDLLFSPGWLSEMIAVAASDRTIGIVNPSSDTLGQKLDGGQTPETMAASLQLQRGQWIEMGAAVGFCMLIKREVQAKVGFMGEHFGMGYFEDTEYCRLAQQHGYKCVRAKASFVHHKENRSFKDTWKNKKEQDAHFMRNADAFYAKWGKPERQAYVLVKNGALDWLRAETLRAANRDANIWVFASEIPPLPEHMNISYKPYPAQAFGWRVLWRILIKKKKFTRIIVNEPRLAQVYRKFHWLHKARIEVRPSETASSHV